MTQTHPLQGRPRPQLALFMGNPGVHHREDHVVEGAEVGQQMKLLKHKTKLAIAQIGQLIVIEALNRSAVELVAARARTIKAAENIHGRALARPRSPHDRQIIPAQHGEAEVIEGADQGIAMAIDLAHIPQLGDGIGA